MKSIIVEPFSGEVFLSDPEIDLMKFISSHHISTTRMKGGVRIDNVKAQKVFVFLKILVEEGQSRPDLKDLWTSAETKKYMKIWEEIEEPKCHNMLISKKGRVSLEIFWRERG